MKEGIFDNYEEFLGCLELLEFIPFLNQGLNARQLNFVGTLLVECEDYASENLHPGGLQNSLNARITATQDRVIAAKYQRKRIAKEAKP